MTVEATGAYVFSSHIIERTSTPNHKEEPATWVTPPLTGLMKTGKAGVDEPTYVDSMNSVAAESDSAMHTFYTRIALSPDGNEKCA